MRYACREYAATAVDVIGRRLRLGFLNAIAAEESLPRVVDIMAEELGWTAKKKKQEMESARDFLQLEMGKDLNMYVLDQGLTLGFVHVLQSRFLLVLLYYRQSQEVIDINLKKEEVEDYVRRFNLLDRSKKGLVPVNEIRKHLEVRRRRGPRFFLCACQPASPFSTRTRANTRTVATWASSCKTSSCRPGAWPARTISSRWGECA